VNTVWPRVRLGDVLRFTPRPLTVEAARTYREIGIRSHSRGIFHKPPVTGLEIGHKKVFYIEPNDFVLNIVFAWEGAVAVTSDAEAGMIASHRFPTFRPDPARLEAKYLQYWCQTELGRSLLDRVSPGGAGRNRTLNRDAFLNQHVPLPPMAEQRRVVKRIGELFARIHEARTLRQDAAETARALLAAARRILIGDTPRQDWIAVSRMVSEIENGKSPRCESRPAHSDEWGVLKVGAVSFGAFNERENKALPSGHPFDGRYEVRAGDFLMSRANTTELVGACTIVGPTRSKLLLSDKIFRFRFRRGTGTAPAWVEHAMKSPALREQIQRGATGTSPTMKNISKEKVLNLLLPPHSPSDQHRIVAELETLQKEVEALRSLQMRTSAELNALLPAILHHAFRREF
jgi:type I restriction enzyme S subunit